LRIHQHAELVVFLVDLSAPFTRMGSLMRQQTSSFSMENTTLIHRIPPQGTWISWLASPARFIITGAETEEAYCISIGTSQIGGGAPPHRHDFEEGFYLLRGSLTFIAGNQTFVLQEGDFINVGANVAHAIRNESGALAEALTLCAPAGFDRFQIEGGYPMDGPDGPLVPMSDAVKERIKASALKHGVEMNPPAESFQVEPRAHVVRAGNATLATLDQTAGRYILSRVTLAPEATLSTAGSVFILEGKLTLHRPEGTDIASEGHLICLPADHAASLRNKSSESAVVLLLTLSA
jgi:quercetin dioxygenase-like cupin family protein